MGPRTRQCFKAMKAQTNLTQPRALELAKLQDGLPTTKSTVDVRASAEPLTGRRLATGEGDAAHVVAARRAAACSAGCTSCSW